MIEIPIYCNNCDKVYHSNFMVVGSDSHPVITFSGSQEQCPNCLTFNPIIDGTYELAGETLKRFKGSNASVTQLNKLRDILERARKQKLSIEQISESVKKEIPELSTLLDIFPKTRTELYAFLTLLIAMITGYITLLNNQDTKKQNKKPLVSAFAPVTNNITNNFISQMEKPIIKKTGRHKKFSKRRSSKSCK